MMKHEFDNLVEIVTSPECYERIEFVYMNSNKFFTKQEIADFYKQYDMNGIEKIYTELLKKADALIKIDKAVVEMNEAPTDSLKIFKAGRIAGMINVFVSVGLITYDDFIKYTDIVHACLV